VEKRTLAACLAFVLITCASVLLDANIQAPRPFRVMTWNIAAGYGDLSQTARVVRDAAPDVVALQEVDVHWQERSRFADQASVIGAALDMSVRFAPIYRLPGAGAAPMREFGVAILSRGEIVEFHNHLLPRLSTQSAATEPELLPGFAEARVDIAGTRVRVFTTHLDYRADRRVRDRQVAQTLERLNAVSGPIVLMGDLNASPDAPELAPLFRRLRDVWPSGIDRGLTYPASTPARRIDYVLVSEELRALDVRVPAVTASDHRPVIADLVIGSE
jgi:endonuclease/exonuclease/phosphatase family metal-dependent hydrolase